MSTQYEQLTLKYTVKLPVFEGPFELLLHLIEEDKIPIQEVSLSHLTEQYLDYLARLEQSRLEIAGEFLVMAAFLIKLKSTSLLPAPEILADELAEFAGLRGREDLLERLIEYKFYKDKARWLAGRKETMDDIYHAPVFIRAEKRPLIVKNSAHQDLGRILAAVLARYKTRNTPLSLQYEKISLGQVMESLWAKVKNLTSRFSFRSFVADKQRLHVVVSFLAALELARQGVVKILQPGLFGEIYLESVPGKTPKIQIGGET